MAASKVLVSLLRANPLYELVLYDRLPADERQAVADLAKTPGFYGILKPQEGCGLGIKSVDRDTALLFLTLREPGPLPAYVRAALGEAAARTVTRLVADGVLEIDSGGAFVSGVAAASLFAGTDGRKDGEGRLARLSRAALRYGQTLALDDPVHLSWRLYSYNHYPLTPRWKRLLPSSAATERFLGIAAGETCRKLLERSWMATGSAPWLSWRARTWGVAAAGSFGEPTWKLYVSPLAETLADGFGAVLEALTVGRATHFKVGADAAGLLRPDKIVAYFPSFERLAEAAEVVTQRLAGVAVQGVPFTSEIGGEGLVSWGVDPGKEKAVWGGGESWRLWLTHRLARALLSARAAAAGVEPWRFAIDRLRLEGVDTDTWTPGALAWRES
jgi:hypothetical protein